MIGVNVFERQNNTMVGIDGATTLGANIKEHIIQCVFSNKNIRMGFFNIFHGQREGLMDHHPRYELHIYI